MTEKGVVVVTDKNGVQSIRSITKHNYDSQFRDACKEICSTWDEFSPEQIEDIINDGVFSNAISVVAIIWLDANGNYNV